MGVTASYRVLKVAARLEAGNDDGLWIQIGQTLTVTVGDFTKEIAGRKIEAGKVYDLTDVLTGE